MSDVILTVLMHLVLIISCWKQIDHEHTVERLKQEVKEKIEQIDKKHKQLEDYEQLLIFISQYEEE